MSNRELLEALSESLESPQLEPADHCWTVLQDHGANMGGWGPAVVVLPWLETPTPFVYTGSQPDVIELLRSVCRKMAQETGKPTRLVRFSVRDDVAVFGGSS